MKPRLHIAIFDGSFKTTSFINRLIGGLSEKHEISVLGFNEDIQQKIPRVQYIALGSSANTMRLLWLSLGYAFKVLFQRGDFNRFLSYMRLLFGLKKRELQQYNLDTALRLLQPDIFHVQWPSLLPWCESVLRDKRIKVVLSQRGYQNNIRPFVDAENFAYLQNIYPKIDGFHSVSKAMVAVSNKMYDSPNKIDRVIYSGFDFEALPFMENYNKNMPLRLLSVGRPHWVKGYSYVLEACSVLKQKGIQFTYTIIGGQGNEELQYRINSLALNTEILLTGKISQEKVYGTMVSSDVLVFPSIKEGLPNVVVEAMATGLPVIATDCGGVSELIEETTGSLVPTRDAAAIAEAVVAFAEKPLEVINEQRKNARNKVMAQHGAEKMVAAMEALYDEVLSKD
ncbi:glycosyltransferase family 4 protein [Marinirhabdus gelatinilytica]|uniref:Colanic acid/amylovoran biosynthesis glycosyltransferase n=1 Tax=Marinirhabdus gelatinilytica TaxID=1703343 RepID=A0A370Q8X7_9FLAO|nr:glycosyltransferase family 4 protein [Marinirhabdus gelatinilytica]RDK84816.1 colanic acid/amylovoran biosynthesis glycosyltransferase [Marinirhabdus gelatinilytica]